MKMIINILHWTPLGYITVPLFKDSTESKEWFFINGLVLGTYLAIAAIALTK
jgi:hypothetical protein